MELLLPLAILNLAVVALYWYERREARIREDAWRLERTGLLNRIQAPEVAPILAQEDMPPAEEPLYVPFDDDNAHDEYMERLASGNQR